jgi:flagellar hook protein FlgE
MGVGNALNTALSGMTAFATQIGYISENLANVSTTGYKGVQSNFQSYVTQSSSSFESPGGVAVTPIYQNSTAGQVTSTSVATNFAIANGTGFAPVAIPSTVNGTVANFSGSSQLYTQACDFSINNNGYLVNSAGDYLMGVKEQTAYQGDIPGTPSLGNLTGVRVDPAVYSTIPGKASSTIDYNANFPASAASGSTATSQVQFFDSLGTAQTLNIVYTKAATANTWTISSATIPSDTSSPALTVTIAPTSLTFTTGGALATPANGKVTFTPSAAFADGASQMTGATALTLKYGTAAAAGPPVVAASGSTQYTGSSLEVRSVSDLTGQAPGSFQSAAIDNNGYVVFNYSNGEQLKPYRVPLVTFANPNELQRVTGATFSGNDIQAGTPSVQWAGEGDAGTITPSSIEGSNVDIATELTQMIVAQRAYTSNSKVISAADQMIQDALALIH